MAFGLSSRSYSLARLRLSLTDVSRLKRLKSVQNFRDFGDYPTSSGGRVLADKLFRAAHFNAVDDEELDYINSLDLGLLVDLRHAPERKRQPNRADVVSALTHLELPDLENKKAELAPHEMFLKERLEKAEDAREYMTKSYAARPHDASFKRIFAQTLDHMAEEGASLVIHCAAGKDRTGTLAAIILKTLGVDDETIMEDYMLTMEAVDVESYLEPAAAFMSQRFDRSISPDALRPMFGVEEQYLTASLEAMGDFDNYLEKTLNVTPQMRRQIVDRFTL